MKKKQPKIINNETPFFDSSFVRDSKTKIIPAEEFEAYFLKQNGKISNVVIDWSNVPENKKLVLDFTDKRLDKVILNNVFFNNGDVVFKGLTEEREIGKDKTETVNKKFIMRNCCARDVQFYDSDISHATFQGVCATRNVILNNTKVTKSAIGKNGGFYADNIVLENGSKLNKNYFENLFVADTLQIGKDCEVCGNKFVNSYCENVYFANFKLNQFKNNQLVNTTINDIKGISNDDYKRIKADTRSYGFFDKKSHQIKYGRESKEMCDTMSVYIEVHKSKPDIKQTQERKVVRNNSAKFVDGEADDRAIERETTGNPKRDLEAFIGRILHLTNKLVGLIIVKTTAEQKVYTTKINRKDKQASMGLGVSLNTKKKIDKERARESSAHRENGDSNRKRASMEQKDFVK